MSLLIYYLLLCPVTSELIHYTVSKNSTDISSQLPLIHVLVPCVMGLKDQLKDQSKVNVNIHCRHTLSLMLYLFKLNHLNFEASQTLDSCCCFYWSHDKKKLNLSGWRRCEGHCSSICGPGWFICWLDCYR